MYTLDTARIHQGLHFLLGLVDFMVKGDPSYQDMLQAA